VDAHLAKPERILGIEAEGNNIHGNAHISLDLYWIQIIIEAIVNL
jgi:hypothetical protein